MVINYLKTCVRDNEPRVNMAVDVGDTGREVEVPGGGPYTLGYLGEGYQWVEQGSHGGILGKWEERGWESTDNEGFVGSGTSTEVEDRSGDSGGRKKIQKNWIKKKVEYSYTLGEDIEWQQVSQMANRTLVGWALGRTFSQKTTA